MNLRRQFLMGMTALTLGAGTLAAHAAGPDTGAGPERHAKSEAGMKEHFDKRQKAMHDKLKLSPEQEGAWTKFVDRMRPNPNAMHRDREKMAGMTAPERMDAMVAHMKEMEGHMTERAAAVKEFYAVLTPEQQKVFNDQFAKMHEHHPKMPKK